MQELATDYGFDYEIATADIDEQALGDRQQSPAALVALLAQAKAEAITNKLQKAESAPLHGYLLTCDQVVVCQDVIREKPDSEEQVRIHAPGLRCRGPAYRQLQDILQIVPFALIGQLLFRLDSFLPAIPSIQLGL